VIFRNGSPNTERRQSSDCASSILEKEINILKMREMTMKGEATIDSEEENNAG
jgi:hypothetical protein